MSKRVLRVGLIGGGGGAFIVQPHQKAIFMDGTRQVVAGALHPDPAVALAEAKNWPYPIEGFESYDQMLESIGRGGLDYVLIVTPNHVHYEPAMAALRLGIPVFCEKPLATSLSQAVALAKEVKRMNIPFCLAHTYIGHWTSRLARFIVRSGLIGSVRWVNSSYLQGWLAGRTEDTGSMQAEWRVDPKRAGISCCGGDIGTHALMQLLYVTGLEVVRVSAHLETFVSGRALDDHFTAYCELSNGGKAMIHASQIAIGHKNDLRIEVNGDKGTLVWRQEEPEQLTILLPNQPDRIYWRGAVSPNDGFFGDIPAELLAEVTIPSGHGEAFHDAFARLHRSFEQDVRAYLDGQYAGTDGSKYATVDDGVAGLEFVSAAVHSSQRNGMWVEPRD